MRQLEVIIDFNLTGANFKPLNIFNFNFDSNFNFNSNSKKTSTSTSAISWLATISWSCGPRRWRQRTHIGRGVKGELEVEVGVEVEV
jgi:hypothetical protein